MRPNRGGVVIEGNPQDYRYTLVGRRRQLEPPAQGLRPPPHAEKTVASGLRAVSGRRTETSAIVAQLKYELSFLDATITDDAGRPGVAHDVVHAFLKDQEDLTAHFRIELHSLVDASGLEFELDVARA